MPTKAKLSVFDHELFWDANREGLGDLMPPGYPGIEKGTLAKRLRGV
ncbi:hypothetical protein [Candidatus Nitrospira salsa]